MALEFRPPTDIIDAYNRRPNPGLQVVDAAQQAMQLYAHLKAQEQNQSLKQQQNDILMNREAREGRQQFYDYGDASSLPQDVQASIGQPAQGPVSAEGVAPQVPSLIDRYNKFLEANPQGMKGTERQRNQDLQQSEINKNNAMAASYGNNPRGSNSLEKILAQKVANGEMTLEEAYKQKSLGSPQSFQIIGTQEGSPVAVNRKTLQTTPVKLPGAGPLTATNQTEGQANAKLYAQRMEEADKQLSTLAQSTDLASVGSGLQRIAPNIMKSGNIQLVEQAQRNFLNAVLRRESGAVISPSEFAEGTKQYFEVMGDNPEVKQQKAMNRKTAIEGLRGAAGMPTTGGSPIAQQQTSTGMEHLSDEELQRIANGG